MTTLENTKEQATETPEELPRQRVRILYEKGERIKFISHLDEFRLWERTLRRADLPLLYKQGFNPQPHIQFASPLGVGITGAREPIDITFSPPLPLDELERRIVEKLPPAVHLHELREVPLKTKSLQSQLIGADYTILIYAEPGEIPDGLIEGRIDEFLGRAETVRERERKGRKYRYNLRPLILELRYEGYSVEEEEHRIFLRVQQREGATGRPDEVVDALGLEDYARTLRRERLYTEENDADVALFSPYPVVTKADISMDPEPPRRRRRGKKRHAEGKHEREARTINERAGDEFA